MRSTLWTTAILGSLCAACSSGYSSGVDGSKPVSELDDDEWTTACENLSDYLIANLPEDRQERFNCYVVALADVTRTPAECEAAFDDCMQNPPSLPLDVGPLECSFPFIDSTCDATVAEAEACINADAQLALDRIAAVDCSAAGNIPRLQELTAPIPTPDECAVLSARCPSLGDGFLP